MQSPSNSQLKAIQYGEGVMLVLAGPGSGKTFTMIQRLEYLICQKQVRPDRILVISFSRAATAELQQRFQKQFCKNSETTDLNVSFSTFHACFFHILKETYHYTSKDIVTEKQKRDILRILFLDPSFDMQEEVGKESFQFAEKAEEYLKKISYYKNKETKELKQRESVQFQRIFHAYNEEMHRQHKLDFDDMGLLCLQLFLNRPEILKKWQERWQFVMIDEFQDINQVQFRIIQLLVQKNQNLFVVGDDDQSIYGFRGASPQIMLDFETYYPKADKVLLETNYRSRQAIVREALQVIEQNKQRFPKQIRAFVREEPTSKEEIVLYAGFENYQLEYDYIAAKIQEWKTAGMYTYTDIACIFRTNHNMTKLADTLIRKQIPIIMKENTNNIFEHFIAKDLIAYLQFFTAGRKREDFFRIMNKPLRYFSRNACSREKIVWMELKQYYASKPYMIRKIEQLEDNERWIQRLDLYGACFYIRNVMGYEEYAREYAKEQNMVWEEVKEILDFIQDSTRGKTSIREWKEDMEQYKEAMKNAKEETCGVQLLTFHACKGLEYETVFLPDCNEGKVPHKKAASPKEIEEERRMFYVAMTRAKRHLEVLYIAGKQEKHLQSSRFIRHRTK